MEKSYGFENRKIIYDSQPLEMLSKKPNTGKIAKQHKQISVS